MKPRAFTLIELLVVIAVIALIIGILLPALAGARASSRLNSCLARVRSVGQGLVFYTADNRGRYPVWSGWQVYDGDGQQPDNPGPGWAEELASDLAGLQVYQDPARDASLAPFAYFMSARYTFIKTGKAYTSLRDSDILLSAQYILGGDCNQPKLFIPPYGTAKFDVPDCDPDDADNPTVFFNGELRPHGGQSNLVFADNHSATFRRYEKDKMTWHPAQFKDWTLN